MGFLLRYTLSEISELESLRSQDSTHFPFPGLLWHLVEGAQVLLREGFSEGMEIISKTIRKCWGLSRPWRTQEAGLALPNSGSLI